MKDIDNKSQKQVEYSQRTQRRYEQLSSLKPRRLPDLTSIDLIYRRNDNKYRSTEKRRMWFFAQFLQDV